MRGDGHWRAASLHLERGAVADGLVLAKVTCHRGPVVVLENASLRVPSGGTLVVTGSNGAGKSTLLQLCAGLLVPQSGTVSVDGIPLEPARAEMLVRRGIRRACVFQQGGLIANISALENVALPLRYHADFLGLSETTIEERARFCLGAVGVEPASMSALPGTLSFGIAKRVAFARAMAIEPNLACFDDPDAGLDRENAEVVEDILMSYRNDPSITMVIATNHRALIERLGVAPHELVGGRVVRLDLLTMPPTSLV
ncbi:MAG: ATP-binding cassette domain-containing protein [Myxococcales bacterium]|nr:ATP-binding cassette domain-containing protein [Myxococcales bacterium]